MTTGGADTSSFLTRDIPLHIPLLSAAMDTVTLVSASWLDEFIDD